jgi:hypothetical protein
VLRPDRSAGDITLRAILASDASELLKMSMTSQPLICRIHGALKTREDGDQLCFADLTLPMLEADVSTDRHLASVRAEAALSSEKEIWFFEWTKNQSLGFNQDLHMRLRVKTKPFNCQASLEIAARLAGEQLVVSIKSLKSKDSNQIINGYVDTHDMGGLGGNWEFKPFDADAGSARAKIFAIVNKHVDFGNPIKACIEKVTGHDLVIRLPKN